MNDPPAHPKIRYKACSKCGQDQPTQDFNRDKKSPDGLRYCCRSCDASRRNKKVDAYSKHKRTVRARGLTTELTYEQFSNYYDMPRCEACSTRLVHEQITDQPAAGTIDRLDARRGYTLANCWVLCARCNLLKAQEATVHEYRRITGRIADAWQKRQDREG